MLLKFRLRLRTLLILLGVGCVFLAVISNWHVRSMAQYTRLTTDDPTNGMFMAEFPSQLQYFPDTNRYGASPNAGFSKYTIQAWLCRFFDPNYACDCVNVFSPGTGVSEMAYVEKLKGVRLIVLRNDPENEILEKWRARFPTAEVITWSEWEALDPKPNTPSD